MAISVKGDLRSIKKAMRKMERAGQNPKKVWRVLRKPLRKDQKEHMRAGKDSKGAKWKPLASSTVEGRLSKGGRAGKFTKRGKLKKKAQRGLSKILSQKLVSGAKVKITRKNLSITSKVPWAGVHQHGGRAGRGARIPAREFFYVGTPLIKQTALALARHISKAYNTGG